MMFSKLQNQKKQYAQLAGFLYLLIAVVGAFSIGYMPSEIVVDGDAGQTFQNLLNQQNLFRWGIVGDIIVLVLEVVLTVILYNLLKTFSTTGIIIATYSRLAMAIIMGFNLVNYMIPVIIMNQPEYLMSFESSQLESLTLLFFKAHKYGELAWQIFFAIHLFTLGYVIKKSKKTPKLLGLLMLVGGIGYGGDSVIQFLFIESEVLVVLFTSLLVLAVIAEFWFAFWLLIKGSLSKD